MLPEAFLSKGFRLLCRELPPGHQDVVFAALDIDFIRRLHARDSEAERELVRIAEANPQRTVIYEICRRDDG